MEQPEHNILENLPEDDRVRQALMIREMQSMNKNLIRVNSHINKFIEVTDRKVDKQVYLSDRDHQAEWNKMLEGRVTSLENTHENLKITKEALEKQKSKFFGVTKEVWVTIIQIIQILVIFGLIGSQA